jgi:hypothetical protein
VTSRTLSSPGSWSGASASPRTRAGENAFSYGLFYERDACMAGDYQEQALAAWQAASAPRFRRWLHGGS